MPPRKDRPAKHGPSVPPPSHPADEQALLGYLLLPDPDPAAWDAIRGELLADTAHRLILAATLRIHEASTAPTPVAVAAALERIGDLAAVGGRAYIARLTDGVLSGARGWLALAPCLAAVRAAAAKRRVASLAADLSSAAQNGHDPAELASLAGQLAAAAQTDEGVPGLPLIDLTAAPEPGKWLVRSVIPEQGRLLLVAPSGTGKSWLLEDLALAVATGTYWLGLEEFSIAGNCGPVLIVDEESAASRIRYRLSRLAAGRSLQMADLVNYVHVSCLAGVNIGNSERWGQLLSTVRRLKPCLVILDAAIRIIAGSEDKSEFVGPFWRAMGDIQVMGPAVAIAHHTGWLEKDRARGSTDWHGGADVVLTLSKTENKDRQKLTWTKMKDPPDYSDPEPIYIDRAGHDQVRLTCGGSAADDKPLGQDLDQAILDEIGVGGRTMERNAILQAFAPRSSATIDRAIKRLRTAGKLLSTPQGYRVV